MSVPSTLGTLPLTSGSTHKLNSNLSHPLRLHVTDDDYRALFDWLACRQGRSVEVTVISHWPVEFQQPAVSTVREQVTLPGYVEGSDIYTENSVNGRVYALQETLARMRGLVVDVIAREIEWDESGK